MARRRIKGKRAVRKTPRRGKVSRRFREFSEKYVPEERFSAHAKENRRLSDEIISQIYSLGGEADYKEILEATSAMRGKRKEIFSLIDDLIHQRILSKNGKKRYALNANHFMEGILSVNPKGFAFARRLTADSKKTSDKDLFIPAREVASGLHGDRVLLQVTASRRGRFEARVVKVLERAVKHIVGIYRAGGELAGASVIPEDERYPFVVSIAENSTLNAAHGEAVLVELQEWGEEKSRATGRVVEILGDPDSIKVQMEIVIRKFNLPHVFDDKTLKQAESFSDKVELTSDRLDLRDVFHVTIDGETARDFDDAVSVQKTKKGYRLYVSIADVSHYVTPGSSLDQDAWERGTSVYFPTGVLPMLPERLSNNLCSLNPDVDRYAFTAILDFDRNGKRLKSQFAKSVIRSARRLTYTLVRQILVDKDPALRRQNKVLLTPLKWMGELGSELEKQRIARGSMGFEIPETFIEIGPDDTIVSVSKRHRNQAHKIIEEFMLAANEAVAETFALRKFAALYRIHQSPDIVKVAEFAEFVTSMGYYLPGDNYSSKWFNKLLEQTKGTPREYLISNLILRVMQQARYSPDNIGHFGLAAPFYTHFTSPIRRYPDLMVHRALKQMLWPEKKKKSTQATSVPLVEAGEFVSKRERVAVDAEREMEDRLKVRYMADKIGEEFSAIISGITSFGLFVQLTETMLSGAVAITDLTEDSYEFHEKRHTLVAGWSGKTYQIGDLVVVRLVSVDKQKQRINFVLVDGNKTSQIDDERGKNSKADHPPR
ncbi:MAG: ribonuclease R [Desulfobulbaceae bacterium]|nr:ribonuclease R [Desulfobulbaceae bacterium]